MFQIGKIQNLYINRFSNYGAYLSDTINGDNEILLPAKWVEKEHKQDQQISVFVYKDIEEGVVATTKKPLLELGDIEMLKVTGGIRSGYFLDMGIDQDLFMPYNEAKGKLEKGNKCLVMLALDENEKLIGTMKIYNKLKTADHFKIGNHVKGTVYEINPAMGAFVAVENQYHGMIPKHELYKEIKVGAHIEARITRIRDDGRVNLSIRERAQVQINDDEATVLNALNESEGVLYMNDDTPPEIIKKRLNLSKRAYKRVIGKLLKEGKITIFEEGIRLIK